MFVYFFKIMEIKSDEWMNEWMNEIDTPKL